VKLLEVCIRLLNISYDKQHFGGCFVLEFEYLHTKEDFFLGCIYKNEIETQRLAAQDILKWDPVVLDDFFLNLMRDVEDNMETFQDISEEIIDNFGDILDIKGEGRQKSETEFP
jgi:hypothetical protein